MVYFNSEKMTVFSDFKIENHRFTLFLLRTKTINMMVGILINDKKMYQNSQSNPLCFKISLL